jgi:sirohydrochlorin ferrochelatase
VSGDPLHLVIHGRAGGEIPVPIRDFASELAERRGTVVRLEALTAAGRPVVAGPPATPGPPPTGRPVTLVPLLLLPGRHVRRDVPAIRRRLREQGMRVRSRPFLGAWPAWLHHLQTWVGRLRQAGAVPLLVHHPLEDRLGVRYLGMLRGRLQVPLVSAAEAVTTGGGAAHGARTLLPLALAPNRMTAALESAPGGHGAIAQRLLCPHLLADPASRSLLLTQLVRLP